MIRHDGYRERELDWKVAFATASLLALMSIQVYKVYLTWYLYNLNCIISSSLSYTRIQRKLYCISILYIYIIYIVLVLLIYYI